MDRVSKYMPELLSIVRLLVGLLFLEHGTSKLFDFPHGPVQPTMGSLIWVQGVIEVVGGALFAVGFLTRPVAFILAGDMAVAYFIAHASKGFFPMLNGGDARHSLLLHLPDLLHGWTRPLGSRRIGEVIAPLSPLRTKAGTTEVQSIKSLRIKSRQQPHGIAALDVHDLRVGEDA